MVSLLRHVGSGEIHTFGMPTHTGDGIMTAQYEKPSSMTITNIHE
jgi:hypothetical protein